MSYFLAIAKALSKMESQGDEIQIRKEDVETEIAYWRYSLSAYVVSQDLPVQVMVNFLRERD